MISSLFLIFISHVFQSANEYKRIKVRPAHGDVVANQQQGILCQAHIWET